MSTFCANGVIPKNLDNTIYNSFRNMYYIVTKLHPYSGNACCAHMWHNGVSALFQSTVPEWDNQGHSTYQPNIRGCCYASIAYPYPPPPHHTPPPPPPTPTTPPPPPHTPPRSCVIPFWTHSKCLLVSYHTCECEYIHIFHNQTEEEWE